MCRACGTKPTCQRYLISRGIKKSRCKFFCEFTANAEFPAPEYNREACSSSRWLVTASAGWRPTTDVFSCWKHVFHHHSIPTASPQHHRSITAASPHIPVASLQHHRSITTVSPQRHRSGSVRAPCVFDSSEEHVALTSVIFSFLTRHLFINTCSGYL